MQIKTWKKIAIEDILNRLEAGMTISEIAIAFDTTKAALHTRLSRNKIHLAAYREARNLEIVECYEKHGAKLTALRYNINERAVWHKAHLARSGKRLKQGEEDGRTKESKSLLRIGATSESEQACKGSGREGIGSGEKAQVDGRIED